MGKLSVFFTAKVLEDERRNRSARIKKSTIDHWNADHLLDNFFSPCHWESIFYNRVEKYENSIRIRVTLVAKCIFQTLFFTKSLDLPLLSYVFSNVKDMARFLLGLNIFGWNDLSVKKTQLKIVLANSWCMQFWNLFMTLLFKSGLRYVQFYFRHC